MKRITSLALALSFSLTSLSAVQAGELAELGAEAAPLAIETWIKGDAVNLSEGHGKHVYVVEFWATWCPPCVASIPHLTELQAKFKDRGVIVIGISDETAEKVKPFVENMGDKMNYRVALDAEKKTSAGYMKAFGQQGIPTAFIVDKTGKVVWVGHPMMDLDKAVEQVVEGTYDIAAAKKAMSEERVMQQKMMAVMEKMDEYFDLAAKPNQTKKMTKLAKKIIADAGDNPMVMNEFSWRIMTDKSVVDRDLKSAMKAAKLAYDATKGKDAAIIDTYARALFMEGRIEEAITEQEKAVDLCKDPRMKADLEKTLAEYKEKAPEKA